MGLQVIEEKDDFPVAKAEKEREDEGDVWVLYDGKAQLARCWQWC